RVALAGGPVAVEFDSALPVEMGSRLVLVEVVENRGERLAAVEHVAGFGSFPVQINSEAGVISEQRLLPVRVAAIGTVGVGVEQLADGQAVGRLGRGDFSLDGHVDALSCGGRVGRPARPKGKIGRIRGTPRYVSRA